MNRMMTHSIHKSAPSLSVVIPVYRSAATLPELIERLSTVLAELATDYEIVLVDDGSPDDSWSRLQQLRAADPEHIVAVQLMRNFGQHNAIMAGLRHARGDYIVTMDDDLQHPPEEISKLLAAIREQDLDLVYGVYGQKKHGSARNLGSGLVCKFYRIIFRNNVHTTSFRIMSRRLVEAASTYTLNFTYIDGLLAWNTTRIGETEVEHHPRAHGKSGYSLAKLLELSLNLFTNFSLLPLRVVSAVGLAVAATGLMAIAYCLVRYVFADVIVPGYFSTIITIMILGGTQLVALGVMGEYLGRLHLNMNSKPQYAEREVLGGKTDELTTVKDEGIRRAA